jgi:hypothetical protein
MTTAKTLPKNSGSPPKGANVSAQQWQILNSLAAHGKLSGVPPAILAGIETAEAPAGYDIGDTPNGNNSDNAGGFFGITGNPTNNESTVAAYENQAQEAASIFATQLSRNNGNALAAEFAYQNGPNAVPGVPINGKLPTLEGVGQFYDLDLPAVIGGHFGNGSGISTISKKLEETFIPTGPGPLVGVTSAGAAAKALVTGNGLATGVGGELPAGSSTAAKAGEPGSSSSQSSNVLTGVESGISKDLEVAGFFLGGVAAALVGLWLLVKRQSQMEEFGWLLLFAGAADIWAVSTKRNPICVLKAAVSGDTSDACAGSLTSGEVTGGILTVLAGGALLKSLGGNNVTSTGNGSSSEEGATSEEESGAAEGAAAAEVPEALP